MRSVITAVFASAQAGRSAKLFKLHREWIEDGNQQRDFIYVNDTVAVMRWLIGWVKISRLFKVDTGKVRSFRNVATALFRAVGCEPNIVCLDMPATIGKRYQQFTQATIERLRQTGYDSKCVPCLK